MTSYQFLPPLSDAEYEALRADIAANGMRHPILVDERGKILDGHHRARIAAELGFKPEREVLAGLTEEEKRDVAIGFNSARRHMDPTAKRAAVVASLKADPHLSDRQHGRRTGVSHPTVAGIRAELVAAGRLESLTSRVGADGRTRPATQPSSPTGPDALTVSATESDRLGPTTAAGAQFDAPADGADDSGMALESHPVAAGESPAVEPAAPARPGPVEGSPGPGRVTPQDAAGSDLGPVETTEAAWPRVVTPAAPVGETGAAGDTPDPLDDREALAEQHRERSSAAVAEALVAIRMRLEPDPIRWLQETWKPGGYRLRDMPRVRDCFTPDGLRTSAAYLIALAEHLEQNGETL